MYKKIRWLLPLFLILSLSSCKLSKSQRLYKGNVQEELMNMEGYSAVAKISSIDNEKTNTYQAKQIYQMDGLYRFEVLAPEHIQGLTTIFNGEKMIQYNPNVADAKLVEFPANNFRNQIFLGTFVKNHLQSEEVTLEVQKIQGDVATVLEAVIPGGSKHMTTQRLWIDQNTHKPIKMVIYNEDNKETVTIEFLEFTYNPKIDESIFNIK